MPTSTIRLHRVLRATPERIYRAFLDADAMVKWLPPNGFTGRVHHLDARVGGTYKMSFTNFTTGHGHSFGGEYLELVPHERIRHTDKFDDPNLPGVMQTTISLKKVSVGTELHAVQEGIPEAIPPQHLHEFRHVEVVGSLLGRKGAHCRDQVFKAEPGQPRRRHATLEVRLMTGLALDDAFRRQRRLCGRPPRRPRLGREIGRDLAQVALGQILGDG